MGQPGGQLSHGGKPVESDQLLLGLRQALLVLLQLPVEVLHESPLSPLALGQTSHAEASQQKESHAKAQIAHADRWRPAVHERIEEAGQEGRNCARGETEVEGVEPDQEVEGEIEAARHPPRHAHQDEDEGQVENHRDAVEQQKPPGVERVDHIEEGAVPGEDRKEPRNLTECLVAQGMHHSPDRATEKGHDSEGRQPAIRRIKARPEAGQALGPFYPLLDLLHRTPLFRHRGDFRPSLSWMGQQSFSEGSNACARVDPQTILS